VNNVIRDIQGAGFGLWGCYDCLFAHNTLLRVGVRSHLIDIKFGEHSCDGAAAAAPSWRMPCCAGASLLERQSIQFASCSHGM
jgi:hypothetical protein